MMDRGGSSQNFWILSGETVAKLPIKLTQEERQQFIQAAATAYAGAAIATAIRNSHEP